MPIRCDWADTDPLLRAYHDEEWGVPERDSRALWEKLVLDGFQAGLSWITILRKRENFRKAFDDFQPEKIARYSDKKVHALMNDAGIVRNRAKIEGTVNSAKAYLKIMEEGAGFSKFLWDFVDGKPIVNQFKTTASVPASTPVSVKISKELGARGFKFVGPTIVYAFMPSTMATSIALAPGSPRLRCRFAWRSQWRSAWNACASAPAASFTTPARSCSRSSPASLRCSG